MAETLSNFSFESIINEVFNQWKCKNIKVDERALQYIKLNNLSHNVVCMKVRHPKTGRLHYMSGKIQDGVMLPYGIIEYSVHQPFCEVFQDVCKKVIYEKFGIDCQHDQTFIYVHNAKFGKQLFELIESMKEELQQLVLDFDNGCYDRTTYLPRNVHNGTVMIRKDQLEHWFDTNIMMRSYYYKIVRNGNMISLVNDLRDDLSGDYSIPFKEQIEVLTAMIWKCLVPEIFKYTDCFKIK